jgi:hypothetical protein
MHVDGSISTISWIPSEAVRGLAKLPFGSGVAHYDDPPPDQIGPTGEGIAALRDAGRIRFANVLSAWAEFAEDGTVASYGYTGGGQIGTTTLTLGRDLAVAAVPYSDLQAPPETGPGWIRFQQTAGGRTGVPTPRTVNRPPFVQISAPTAWTTLALTLHADGRAEGELVGASTFPRHWVYDHDGELTAKSGLIDFKQWYHDAFDDHTPWGDTDSEALVTEVETALERELSTVLMRSGRKPRIVRVKEGDRLVTQGDPGEDMFVILDGVVSVSVDDTELCLVGPGAVMGERGLLEGGRRTATVQAVTNCSVAVASADEIDEDVLRELADLHRREDATATAEGAARPSVP